jgi:hypothetical protein
MFPPPSSGKSSLTLSLDYLSAAFAASTVYAVYLFHFQIVLRQTKMVEKRSKNTRKDDLETTPTAPSATAQSSLTQTVDISPPEPNDIVEQNTTGTAGVVDQPESPDARDEDFLNLLRQAPG